METRSEENSKLEIDENLGLTYEEFVNRLTESQKTVLFLKEYIESKGYRCRHCCYPGPLASKNHDRCFKSRKTCVL